MSDGNRKRNRNGGIRKRCGCPPKTWSKCQHPWHFNFKWKGVHYRLSLDREAGRHIDGKSKAQAEADRIRDAIRANRFRRAEEGQTPGDDCRPTVGQIANVYLKKHVAIIPETGAARRPGGRALMELHIKLLREASVPDGRGGSMVLDAKPLDDLTVADLEAIREGWPLLEAASRNGRVGADKALKRLRHFCNWAVERGYASRTPFRTGNGVVAFHFAKEQPRSRRLEGDEEQRLIDHADSHMRGLVIAALETACRKGELLELRWRDVKWDQNVLLVPASVSKTAEDRDVPMTRRLRAVLEMRGRAADGKTHRPDAFVFGNDLGERVGDVRSQWERCCRAAGIEGLVFHDLRREAASRLRESGAPDHVVAAWLGHANISTTSRYLRTSRAGLQRYLQGFEKHRELCTSVAHTPSNEASGIAFEAHSTPTNTLN